RHTLSLHDALPIYRDTTFTAGRAQAANNAGLRFGPGLILGFAVGTLWLRFRSKRVSLAQTALRLYPRRRAICAALCPTDQSFLSSVTSFVSQLMGDTYTPTANYKLVGVAQVAAAIRSSLHQHSGWRLQGVGQSASFRSLN